jgi:uncharacterized tellurite resistance protein B-like protein
VSFLRFLQPGTRDAPRPRGEGPETKTIRRIVSELEALPPEQAAFLAGFAYVLARVAHADLDISEEETREIERIVAEWGGLSEAQAVLAVEIAKSQTRLEGGTEDFLVTRRFRELSTPDQRERLLHCLFAVASAAGDTVSAEESHEIRQIADELGFSLPELNQVRHHYRDRLAALRRDDASASAG